jgi:hypothetical protein
VETGRGWFGCLRRHGRADRRVSNLVPVGRTQGDVRAVRGAAVLGHEGGHAYDFKSWFGWRRGPQNASEVAMSERNAYSIDQSMQRASGVNLGQSPPHATAADLEREVQAGVQRSLDRVCSRAALPGC